jgi:hypothetical protein
MLFVMLTLLAPGSAFTLTARPGQRGLPAPATSRAGTVVAAVARKFYPIRKLTRRWLTLGGAAPERPRPVCMTAEMKAAAADLVEKLGSAPTTIEFEDTMSAIAEMYEVTEVPFSVGDVVSAAGDNMGSAKIFSFAKLANLDEAATLQLFGRYYRVDVLKHPEAQDHANIRAFMRGGWGCVSFPEGLALSPRLA